MAKILVTRHIPGKVFDMLKGAGHEVDICKVKQTGFFGFKEEIPTKADILKALKNKEYDGMISLLTDHIDAEVLASSSKLKIISNYAVGFNNIDIEEAKKRGVIVTNTPGSSSESVAEFTIGLILASVKRIVEGDKFLKTGKYQGWSPELLLGQNLSGKTLGILGAGRIGAKTAEIAKKGFNMKVIYYDVVRNEKLEKEIGAIFYENIDEVFKKSDILSVHVPLLPSTKHLVNENRMKMMKKDACLINTSRGAVVDEKALQRILKDKIIAGAALDVLEFEPKTVYGLTGLQNIILTPHIASSTLSTREEMSFTVAKNIIDYFSGKEPINKVF